MNGTVNDFMKLIEVEINNLKQEYLQFDKRFENNNFALNYWIAKTFYNVSDDFTDFEEYNLITFSTNEVGFVIDSNDADDHDIFIVHCMYLANNTIQAQDVDKFLTSPLNYMFLNDYEDKKLKQLLLKHKDDSSYTVYERFYYTRPNNAIKNEIKTHFKNFKANTIYKFNVLPKLITLDEMKIEYYHENINNDFVYDISYQSKTRIIELNSEQENKEDSVNTLFFAMEVSEVYKMLKESKLVNYNLFDENIREYLGITGKYGKINKNVQKTLEDPLERNRFFYYNNGITMICKKWTKPTPRSRKKIIHIERPQIVNGCQTVGTISKVFDNMLEKYTEAEVCKEFNHCLVLVKVYELDKNEDKDKDIYKNIVQYTNMQTGITQKDFVSADKYFRNLQKEFKKYGFNLLVLQSDKQKFENDMIEFNELKSISNIRYKTIVGLDITKPLDISIPLDKLLRVLMAFYFDGYEAFVSSSYLLKPSSVKYYINFSKCITDYFSIENMINLYLVFVKCGGTKIARQDRYPVPHYLLDFIGRKIKYTQNVYDTNKVNNKLNYMFSSQECFDEIYTSFKLISTKYSKKFMRLHNVEYATMTKHRKIDEDIINEIFDDKLEEAQIHNMKHYITFIS